jgi:hypothetical protein
MKQKKVNFDEARRIFMEQKLAKNGIAADGRPTGVCFVWARFAALVATV